MTIRERVRRVVAVLVMLSSLPALAGEGEGIRQVLALSLEEQMAITVKIASQMEQSMAEAPAVVSVITADDLRATGATNLMEILQSVPGVYVKTNLFGAKPLLSMRGASGVNVLLMIDGAPAKDLVWSPGIFWKGVPANMIERIEIIRGPGSALFGADASAGVINVVTKTAGRISGGEAGLRVGSDDSWAGWLQQGGQWNGFAIAFTADLAGSEGHSPWIARDKLGSAGHAYFGHDDADLHLSIARQHWRLLVDHTRHEDVGIGLTGAAVLDPLTRAKDRQSSLALLYQNDAVSADWGLSGEARFRDLAYDSGNGFWERPPGPGELRNVLAVAERRVDVELMAHYRGRRDHLGQFGAGHVWQTPYDVSQTLNGVPAVFVPEKTRRNAYLFVQDIWHIAPEWELTAGARYDHYSDFGSTLNPRLALVWQSSPRLTTKLMYGQAFRAPSYLELYSQTAANAANPDLRPERSRTVELSFNYRASRDLNFGLNVYRFVRSDVIAPEALPPYRFANLGRYVSQGIELEAQWQAGRSLRLSGNVSQMQLGAVDDPLRDLAVPRRQAYLRADWMIAPKWHWNLQAHWFDRRPLPANDPRMPLGSALLLSTSLRYFHGSDWEFAATLRNLADRDLHEYSSRALVDNLPLPGRSFAAELRYKF
ncbi:TonB-dependent receptor plug domain-containing protein [Sulfuricystis multivorans]|uniref:TonB-dependent receptor plug domain-containing protein n=1 Tax=Sulfuricystis multivorans TaxID=2211108 RepID=UPI000F83443A|nr:TonB-dependent receptor [Sulfuricystis multivorans]